MKRQFFITIATSTLLVSAGVFAQDSNDFKDGYAKGYKDGFDAGYRKAVEELRNAPPPPPVAATGFPIAIVSATYGPEGSNERCDATHYVRKNAAGRRNATVPIENTMCGDPAPGKRKSVEISYLCGNVAKTTTAYEHRSAYLSCD